MRLCDNSCPAFFTNDGVRDDGGEGSRWNNCGQLGTDCADCGRSESMEVWAEAAGNPFKAFAAKRARHRVGQMAYARRKLQALPELSDAHELHHLNRTLAMATSWHLPKPWLEALRITDHWDRGETVGSVTV